MATLVPVAVEGATVYVESATSGILAGGAVIQEASAVDAAAKAIETAQQLSSSIKSFCQRVVSSLRDLGSIDRPSKTTVEFGLSITAEGNVYLVKSTGEASIKITAEWKFSEDPDK